MIPLPTGVAEKVEFHPTEDILLYILREAFPDLPIQTLVQDSQEFPFVLVRQIDSYELYTGDPRFLDSTHFSVHVFVPDPDSDEKGALIAEAIRVVLRDAWLAHKSIPGLGSVVSVRVTSPPVRVADWATSTGPVQYADLPTGTKRYETQYSLVVRKPR